MCVLFQKRLSAFPQAELFTECTSWSDKYHIMAFFAGGSLLFMSLMILPAHSIIDFRLEQACLDLNTVGGQAETTFEEGERKEGKEVHACVCAHEPPFPAPLSAPV